MWTTIWEREQPYNLGDLHNHHTMVEQPLIQVLWDEYLQSWDEYLQLQRCL